MINGDQLHVFRIRVDKEWGAKVYLFTTRSSGFFSVGVTDNCSHYQQTGELKFKQESKLALKLLGSNKNVYWCFMDDTLVNVEENVEAHPFTYQDKNYVLYIKYEDAK